MRTIKAAYVCLKCEGGGMKKKPKQTDDELRENGIPVRCDLIRKDKQSTVYLYSLERLF